jgi:hypothetical protein
MKPRSRLRRVIVYGMPRSATSVTLELICQKFGLQNFGEINNPEILSNNRFAFMYSPERMAQAHAVDFGSVPQGRDMIPWLQAREPWAVKFITNHVGTDLVSYVQALAPDHVVVLDRQDLVACFLSLCWAQRTQVYHHRTVPMAQQKPQRVDPELARSWVTNILLPFQRDLAALRQLDCGLRVWTKEHVENNGELELSGVYFSIAEFRGRTVASELPYRSLCSNEAEISDIIQGAVGV